MKRLAAFLFALPLACAFAQTPMPGDAATPFAEPPPDESSPFFTSSETRAVELQESRLQTSPSSGYPRVRQAPDTALGQVRGFFKDLIPPIRFGGLAAGPETVSLVVEPEAPLLADQRELGVTYTVRNNSSQMTRLEFPTSQRIEILTKNATGGVVDRWSDDRAFQPYEGIVVINPRERIEYREKVSTREMRGGATYTIETSMAADPDFPAQKLITPR
jgi:hypothetical protein